MNKSNKINRVSRNKIIPIRSGSQTRLFNENKVHVDPLLAPLSKLFLIGLWVGMCFSHNLFINESLICASILVSIIFFQATQNDDSKNFN